MGHGCYGTTREKQGWCGTTGEMQGWCGTTAEVQGQRGTTAEAQGWCGTTAEGQGRCGTTGETQEWCGTTAEVQRQHLTRDLGFPPSPLPISPRLGCRQKVTPRWGCPAAAPRAPPLTGRPPASCRQQGRCWAAGPPPSPPFWGRPPPGTGEGDRAPLTAAARR